MICFLYPHLKRYNSILIIKFPLQPILIFSNFVCYTNLEKQQVRSDNDASEVSIFGHFGTFWDTLGQFGRLFDEFEPFRLFSQSFPTIFIHYRLI